MLRQNKIFLSLLVLSLGVSLSIKVYITEGPLSVDVTLAQEKLVEDVLQENLNAQGLVYHGMIDPVNRGHFPIHIYQSDSCDGAIAILLLKKNSEGTAILAHQFNRSIEDVSYIYDGLITNYFPAFDYWFKQVLQALHIPTNSVGNSSRYVISAIESSGCQLLPNLNWEF